MPVESIYTLRKRKFNEIFDNRNKLAVKSSVQYLGFVDACYRPDMAKKLLKMDSRYKFYQEREIQFVVACNCLFIRGSGVCSKDLPKLLDICGIKYGSLSNMMLQVANDFAYDVNLDYAHLKQIKANARSLANSHSFGFFAECRNYIAKGFASSKMTDSSMQNGLIYIGKDMFNVLSSSVSMTDKLIECSCSKINSLNV